MRCFFGYSAVFFTRPGIRHRYFGSIYLLYLSIIIILLPELLFAASSYYRDFEIIRSDENGIAFNLKISDPDRYITAARADSGLFAAIPVLIAVPPGSEAILGNSKSSLPISIGVIENGIWRSGSDNIAEISSERIVRGKKIAALSIYPFYGGILYTRIEIVIDFRRSARPYASAEAISRDKIFDAIFGYSVINYDQSRNWPLIKAGPIIPKAAANVFELADKWYKITTATEGFIKVTGQNLKSAGMLPANLHSDSLHLFYGGGMPLPVMNSVPRRQLNEISIKTYDGGDGIFGLSDYFIFFAESADRWRHPDDSSPVYLTNPYTGLNYYWLALSGDFGQAGWRMDSIGAEPVSPADTVVTRTVFHSHIEENKILFRTNDDHIFDYYNWYWSDDPADTFFVSLPNAIVSEMSSVRVHAQTRDAALVVNGQPATELSTQPPDFIFSSDRLIGGLLNRFALGLDSLYNAPPYLDFVEVSYLGSLTPSNNILDFSVGAFPGIGEFVIDNRFNDSIMIFEISDPYHPAILTDASISTSDIVFQAQTESPLTRFYLCTKSRFSNPIKVEEMAFSDLLSNMPQTDLFVIAPEAFLPSLEDYESYRESISDISVTLVSFEEIINRFSFGQYDPTAVRDFLKYAYDIFPPPVPSAVLLVGDGNYDFRGHLQTNSMNYIPPYVHTLDSTSSDDNYVYFGQLGFLDGDSSLCDTCDDRGYDMMIARWPVRNISELNGVIEKVKSYESSANFDSWRSVVTLVADDDYAGSDKYEGLIHATQTEILQKYHLPSFFRRNKIYLWEYPTDSEHNKPTANEAIVRSINDGTLVVNYVGHGNPDTWAHEHVFNRGTDLQKLNNPGRLPLVFTASCSIGFFDDPSREGMAEELLRLQGSGAIGTVAATRLVYSYENRKFNELVYDILFRPDQLSICQSVFVAKLLRQTNGGYQQDIVNDRKYAYFGDPFLELGIPAYKIIFTDYPQIFTALATHQVSGEVVAKATGEHVSFNGESELFVYDSEIQKLYKGLIGSDSLRYARSGPGIYRGTADIKDGYFNFSFIIPLDVGYGGEGAKIFAYAVSPTADAVGVADSIPVSSEIASSSDTTGPVIEYSFGERQSFLSGDIISSGEPLRLTLSDSTGVNLTGGSGHGITLTIDNAVENVINLTDLFRYDAGSFTAGEIRHELGKLPTGIHRFKVKAWDNANNSSVAEFDAEVVGIGQFALTDLLNYPNPMERTTTFSFSLAGDAKKVCLDIFTLSGKKILHYEENSIPADFHEFYEWDGCDTDKDRVATGVYIYKVTAFSMYTDDIVESFGKVVVVN